jgi:hypothetical protein
LSLLPLSFCWRRASLRRLGDLTQVIVALR